MIVDCFTFLSELDLLEIRLSVLDDVVDRFVLCEAPFTFRGAPKPLVYAEHRDRFARWADRIVHLVYDAPPSDDAWHNEWGQRAHLTSALRDLAPDDHILISDVDEIPAPENVARRALPGRVLVHRQRIAVGFFNRIAGEAWCGTRALAHRDLGQRTLNDIRFLEWSDALEYVDGGWHLTSLGGAAVRADKFHTLSHSEADIPYYADHARLALEYATETGARWTPLDAALPPAFHDPRWSHYVWPLPPPRRADELVPLLHAHGCFASVPADASVIGVLAARDRAAWATVGLERFGAAFVGASASVAAVCASVPRGGWVVIDRLECWSVDELAALCAHGVNAIGFSENARSFAVVETLLGGAPFPSGRAYGIAEVEAMLHAAGFAIERRDDIAGAVAFPRSKLPPSEPFAVDVGWLKLAGITHASLRDLLATGVVYTLRPSRAQAGANTAATLSEL